MPARGEAGGLAAAGRVARKTLTPGSSPGQALSLSRGSREQEGPVRVGRMGIKFYERPTKWTARVRGFPGTAIAVPECHATFIGRSPHIRQRSKSHEWHHPYASPPQRFGFLGTTPMSGMGPLCTKSRLVGSLFLSVRRGGYDRPAAVRGTDWGVGRSGGSWFDRTHHERRGAHRERRGAHHELALNFAAAGSR